MTTLWRGWGPQGGLRQPAPNGCRVALGVELGKPTHFTVNAKAAGKGKLDVQFSGTAKGEAVRDVDIIDHHDNTYTVKYTPIQQVAPLTSAAAPLLHPPRPWSSLSGGLAGLLQEASRSLPFPTWETVGMKARGGRGEPVVWPAWLSG